MRRPTFLTFLAAIPVLCGLLAAAPTAPAAPAARASDNPALVETMRVPDGGVQPQAAVAANGMVHLIYLKGDPAASDVYYTWAREAGAVWSKPIRVNRHPGAAI